MDTAEKILFEAQNHIDPFQFDLFSSIFPGLHRKPRASNWNEQVLGLLEWMGRNENMTKNFCRYLLSLGVRLSDELYFVTNACELLAFSDYSELLTLTSRFLHEPCEEQTKLRLWLDLLEKVWRSELLRRWLLRLSRKVFPNFSERMELLDDLRQVLSGDRFFKLISFGNTFEHVKRAKDESFQVEYLQTVVEEYLPNNYYLRNRFLVHVAGGEMFILPRRGLTLPCNDSVNPSEPKKGRYGAPIKESFLQTNLRVIPSKDNNPKDSLSE